MSDHPGADAGGREWDRLPNRAAKLHAIAALRAQGLTQRQVARRLGVAQSHVCYYINHPDYPEWGHPHPDVKLDRNLVQMDIDALLDGADVHLNKPARRQRGTRLTDDERGRIIEALMRRRGDLDSITREFGVSRNTLNAIADSVGIERPGQGHSFTRPAGTPTKAELAAKARMEKKRQQRERSAAEERPPLDLGSLPPNYVVGSHRNFIDRLTEYLRTMQRLGGKHEILLRWSPAQAGIYADSLDRLARALADWQEDLRSEYARRMLSAADAPPDGSNDAG